MSILAKKCQFWPKNGQILATNGLILAISEFSRYIHNDFLKEDHKGKMKWNEMKYIYRNNNLEYLHEYI